MALAVPNGDMMKTFILWQDGRNKMYKGVVGGALWDQYLVNARLGHGSCYLVDGNSVKEAKENAGKVQATSFPNVFVYGENAIKALNGQGGQVA